MKIPPIIHQIWSGIDGPLPPVFKSFSETWKIHHPEWEYEFWDHSRMNHFVQEFYPQYRDAYNRFPHHIQRWDSIRYLILYKMGGLYVDLDSECLKPLDELFGDWGCCFSLEPEEHRKELNLQSPYFNNALMASIPGHLFMEKVIGKVFNQDTTLDYLPDKSKVMEVFCTTGPLMLVELYKDYADKDDIYLIPSEYTSPLTKDDIRKVVRGDESEELEAKIKHAYAIHYFFHGWIK